MPDADDFHTIDEAAFERWRTAQRADRRRRLARWLQLGLPALGLVAAIVLLVCVRALFIWLLLIAFVVAAFTLYFYPSYVARDRRHQYVEPIFALNLLLGWTVLGWIAALIWAYTRPPGATDD